MDFINDITNQIISIVRSETEMTLAEIIEKYDFLVGSIECKYKLMEILPEDAKIICSPLIQSPSTIFAIKKFDISDLLPEQQEKG